MTLVFAAPSNILPIGCGLSHAAGAIWETQCSRRWKTNAKNVAKRIFGAYIVRDLGKFKKYEEKLGTAAENLEVRV